MVVADQGAVDASECAGAAQGGGCRRMLNCKPLAKVRDGGWFGDVQRDFGRDRLRKPAVEQDPHARCLAPSRLMVNADECGEYLALQQIGSHLQQFSIGIQYGAVQRESL